jgi:hypothetical protein
MTNLGAARSIERKQDFGDREPFPRGAERRYGPGCQELCSDLPGDLFVRHCRIMSTFG